jgi:hypothetical protein
MKLHPAPPLCGLQAENGKHVSGDALNLCLLHVLICFVGKVRVAAVSDSDQISVLARSFAHELKIRISPAVEILGFAVRTNADACERVKPVRTRRGQRTKENRIDKTKRGGAGAYREREGENCGKRGDFVFGELAIAEDGVSAKRIEPREDLLISHPLLRLPDAAELKQRLAACFFRAHARVKILLDS